MYPPNHNQPKVPPVRPRSSLSSEEHHRYKGSKLQRRKPSNTVLTLTAFCVFLFVLCIFLLGALVYVGRTIAIGVPTNVTSEIVVGNESTRLSFGVSPYPYAGESTPFPAVITKSNSNFRLTFRPSTIAEPEETTTQLFFDEIMNASKILSELSYRLPRDIRPKKYRLYLHPDLKETTFKGNVTINLEVLHPISYIAVHANKLSVQTDEVFRITTEASKNLNLTPAMTFHHPDYELWVTEFSEPLDIGEYAISLSFNGSLTNRIVGMYQSTYWDKIQNEQRSIASTKFEPTYARQAFPCFDEPAMKATFKVTLVRPTDGGYHALSNMNQESETIIGENTEVTFAETVPMSTYLACFIISDFAHQSATVKGGQNASDFEMRAYATKHQLSKVSYALSTGVRLAEFYINYFGIPYPLPKLDLAAIPDFVSGAMEHWGLVTFRETALLYDKEISSSQNKQRVATVIAHELAHMWFGNLVTMKWWNDLWLNEGFASYIEYKGLHEVHPEWKVLDQFLIFDMHGVMKLDSSLASHPIVQVAENPNQITELFDQIAYSKGASIIRMLEKTIGSDNFRIATQNYLNKFKYNNAETDDFLNEVEAIGFDFDVKYMMKTWTEQMGLPVVTVTKISDTDYKLTQKRFLTNPGDYDVIPEDSQFNYRWYIPITYFTDTEADTNLTWFNHNDAETIIKVNESVEWIKINKDQMGYYLVNYSEDMWKSLTSALIYNMDTFSVSDRAHLLTDAFTLASATQLPYDIALDLTTYLENEREFVPWNVATSKLKDIKNLLYYTDLYNEFQTYVRKLIDKTAQEVNWEVDDNHLKNLLRTDILSAACGFGHTKTLEEVSARFKAWISKPSERPHPDLRSIIYYFGMKETGNEENWKIMWDLFVNETDASEKIKLMNGLAAISEPWILQRFVNLAWNETYVRSQDYFTCIAEISRNPSGTSIVWDYVRENWPKMVDRFGINERYMGKMIPIITSRFSTLQKLEEMEFFFQKYPEAGAGTAARKLAIENVKSKIKWLEVNKEKVGSWLAKQ